MNLLDIILFFALIGFVYKGAKQGIAYMVGQALGIMIGVLIASRLFDDLANLVKPLFLGNYDIAALVSFVFAFQFINEALGYALRAYRVLAFLETLPVIQNFETLDKWGGALLGLFVGNLIIGIVLFFLARNSFSPSMDHLLATSNMTPHFIDFAGWFTELFPSEFKELPSVITKI